MSNRLSRIAISIPTPSSDGRYYGRYPQGNRPSGAIAAAAASALTASGSLSTGGGGGSGDWATRSTAAGVVFAAPLATSSELSSYYFTGTETTPPVVDAALAALGQPGSIKFTVAPTDGTQSGLLKVPWGTSFGPGTTVYVALRVRAPPELVYMVAPTSDGSVQGFKQMIVSGPNNSHENFEVVWESNRGTGTVLGYNANNDSHPPPQNEAFFNWGDFGYTPAAGTGFDFAFQPLVGNDGSGTVTPDSIYSYVNGGTDPDDGLPFSNSKANPLGGTLAQIEWARIGGSYNSQQDPAFAYGLGHPLAGAMRYPLNQFFTLLYKIVVGAWGTASSVIEAWCAPEGQPYYKLVNNSGIYLDSDVDPGFGASWILPYYTNRVSGGVSVASRSNSLLAACTAIRVVGLGSALGAGTLTYTASTKRFTWAEAGGSAGTARGVSSQKTRVNVMTSGGTGAYATGKYLGIEVTNFAALPVTDQTDTITIQNGRMATQMNVNELIVSSQPINATAFNASGVQVGPTGGYAPPA